MSLTGPQHDDLVAALMAAFTVAELERYFKQHLHVSLKDITATGVGMDVLAAAVVDWSEVHGRERPLVRMMHHTRSGTSLVAKFMDKHLEFPAFLSPAERDDLVVGLSSVLKTIADLQAFLTPAFPAQPAQLLAGAALGSPAVGYLNVLVRWADDFDQLNAVITRARQRFAQDPVVIAKTEGLVQLIAGRRPALHHGSNGARDPIDACSLDGMLMIDREPLRKAMRGFISASLPLVVGVSGTSRSGMTHSKYLVRHVEAKLRKFDVVVIDTKDEAIAKFGPDALIRKVVRQWLGSAEVPNIPLPNPAEDSPRWLGELADHLVGEANKRRRLLVLVLDGFANASVPVPTRELLGRLVKATGEYLRLILIEYPADILVDVHPRLTDTHHISLMSETEVRAFFTAYSGADGNTGPATTSLDDIVKHIFRAPAPVTNEEIANRVDSFIREAAQS
jgi:hypothetical protein